MQPFASPYLQWVACFSNVGNYLTFGIYLGLKRADFVNIKQTKRFTMATTMQPEAGSFYGSMKVNMRYIQMCY